MMSHLSATAQFRLRLLLTICTLLQLVHAAKSLPFNKFLPFYTESYKSFWEGKCDDLLAVRTGHAWCENISDCILEHTPETQKANMAGAGVLLGLLPSLLSQLSPSLRELTALFDQRPILAILTTAMNPGVFLNRLFARRDSSEDAYLRGKLKDATTTPEHDLIWRPSFKGQVILSIVEYSVALLGCANVYQLAMMLATRVVISWSCPNPFWFLGWTMSILFVMLMEVIVSKLTTRRRNPQGVISPGPDFSLIFERIWTFELAPCCTRIAPQYDNVTKGKKAKFITLVLRYLGPTLATVHWVVGTALLSSVLYVPFMDAVPLILRWSFSGFVARTIVEYELAVFAPSTSSGSRVSAVGGTGVIDSGMGETGTGLTGGMPVWNAQTFP
jgi:hypothetical protein